MLVVEKPLIFAQSLVARQLNAGDTAIDATAGNGNDTLFLARCVGEAGRVFAFDIQSEAINRTQRLLRQHGIEERVRLIRDGHEHLHRYLTGPVSAAMFNLGYLPGADHRVITGAQTTIQAIDHLLALLAPGGLITLVVYTGHHGGAEEAAGLLQWLAKLDQRLYRVLQYAFINQVNNPPFLLAIQRCAQV